MIDTATRTPVTFRARLMRWRERVAGAVLRPSSVTVLHLDSDEIERSLDAYVRRQDPAAALAPARD